MKLVFIADEFKLRTPEQQLLDRFLIGYPNEGTFHRPGCEVQLVAPEKNAEIERRIKDFGLKWQAEGPSIFVSADAAMIFNGLMSSTPPWLRSFIYPMRTTISDKGVTGTAIRGAWLLPEIAVPKNSRLAKGVVIVQGTYPVAELEALDALLPLIWRPGEKVRTVTHLSGNDLWNALKRDFWPLVKSAISRSDTPQGDALRDGRTQDLVGLGLLQGLVKTPRGWLIEHEDGLRYVIAVMDGAVADYNVAIQTRAGGILSAQVHRGPPPGEHHYDRLAAMLERYFHTGAPPWPPEQSVLVAKLVARFDALYGERRR